MFPSQLSNGLGSHMAFTDFGIRCFPPAAHWKRQFANFCCITFLFIKSIQVHCSWLLCCGLLFVLAGFTTHILLRFEPNAKIINYSDFRT